MPDYMRIIIKCDIPYTFLVEKWFCPIIPSKKENIYFYKLYKQFITMKNKGTK